MRTLFLISALFIASTVSNLHQGGVLFPRETETRQLKPLDGLWDFTLPNATNQLEGFNEKWYKTSLKSLKDRTIHLMPVPASYNDITVDPSIRDHVGLVWYQRTFYIPSSWREETVWLRFGSVSYAAQVWINGELVMSHEIGHLPFVANVTRFLIDGENTVTVACDNTLLEDTVPQGSISELSSGRLYQSYTFDFFNYAGIDRPVYLYTTPNTFIDDISVGTTLNDDESVTLDYAVSVLGEQTVTVNVTLYDKEKKIVTIDGREREWKDAAINGRLEIAKPNLWWPYLMDDEPAYLYELQVELLDSEGYLVDVYRLPVGLRTIQWTNTSLLINKRPIYLHGFGRHEDSDIRGKGLDLSLIMRDYNLIKWIGANVYRTSHYPYAEEIMDLADQVGIMIIDECPSVNTDGFQDALLAKHKQSLTELIRRDKNRPSVIVWSAANEPRTANPLAGDYFHQVIDHIKTLDTTRPTTIVEAQEYNVVNSSQYVDVISFNKYYGWYTDGGNLDVVTENVLTAANGWHDRFDKPVMMMEYGADTMEGLHILPDFIWSEEYQAQLMSQHFKAFDQLRERQFFIGEFIWNFADFKTAQTYTRVGGNKKGVFTRNRQPKKSAFLLRERYWGLAQVYNNVTLPRDLESYVISSRTFHDEL